MRNSKPGKSKIKVIKPKKKRDLKEVFDQDYINSLPPEDQQYIRKFNNEFYRASKLYDEDSLHQDPELRKAANRNREAFDREIHLHVTSTGTLPDPSSSSTDPMDALIEMYDRKYNPSDDE